MKKLIAVMLAIVIVLSLTPMAVLADNEAPTPGNDETTPIPFDDDCEHANVSNVPAVNATCTTAGNVEYWYCADCDKYFSDAACTTETTLDATVVNAPGHDLAYAAEGNVLTETCSRCEHTATATISATDAAYTGSAIETATVAYSDSWLGGELTIVYENNVEVGTATAGITVGEETAAASFTISSAGKRGDYNGDDKVNLKDVMQLWNDFVNSTIRADRAQFGDYNKDGKVNLKDVMQLWNDFVNNTIAG